MWWRNGAYLYGNRAGLLPLRAAVDRALAGDGMGKAEVFVADSEGCFGLSGSAAGGKVSTEVRRDRMVYTRHEVTLMASPVLTNYIAAAMRRARYETLEDGTFFGEIPECEGLWANAPTLEECRSELQSALESWIILGLGFGDPLPVLDGIDINPSRETAKA